MNQEKNIVKITDILENQIPEFINSENSNFVEFLTQYYYSQEFQGGNTDLAENLVSYKNIDSFDSKKLIASTKLTSDIEFYDDTIYVTSTDGWPNKYGLLKIDDEIITYTGITTTSFTGCIRGFSAISSLSEDNNPEYLTFLQTESNSHTGLSTVHNLSNLFLQEFFRKTKYQFTPGFEEIEFNSKINVQNFISKAKSFYQSKGTDEAFKILFRVLYGEEVKIIKPDDYCFTPSDDKWVVTETFVCELMEGNPYNTRGQTLYQDAFANYEVLPANGSIYDIQSYTNNSNETFYKLKLFSGYSNNLNPKGSISGTFKATPKTFVVEDIEINANTINVNSTIGFGNTGTLQIENLIISYSDKTNNQFLNCTGVTASISKKTKVFSDHYVYAYDNENLDNIVKFRLCNVLSSLKSSDAIYSLDNDPIQIESFGSTEESTLTKSLIYNHPISVFCGVSVTEITPEIRNYQKEGFSLENGASLTKYDHNLRTGDFVDLYLENTNTLVASDLSVKVLSPKEFTVPLVEFPLGKNVLFRRKLKKSSYKNLNLTANIQDLYLDNNYYYLTSNGLPEYIITPLEFESSFDVNIDYTLNSQSEYNFFDGDCVTVVDYSTTSNFKNEVGIQTGISYYVKTISSTQIKLCYSRENVGISSFVQLFEYDTKGNINSKVTNIKLKPNNQYGYNFNSSKLFKKIPKNSEITKTKEKTPSGGIGIFTNGVEIKNYKSFDKVYYGPIVSLDVLNFGEDYNLYNPPQFKITYYDQEYTNAKIIPQLRGNKVSISVVDPGFDYVETPTVKIFGGNNDITSTKVKMKNVTHEVIFNSSTKSSIVNTISDTFIFDNPHRFVTGEPIRYETLGSSPIGIGTVSNDGYLINNAIYYAVNTGYGTSLKLAFNKEDALFGKNLINIRTYGNGIQKFSAILPKKGIDNVIVDKNDKDFEYKKISFIHSNVNIQEDIIEVENHGFSTGEEVVYSYEPISGFNGGPIGGLVVNENYYIVKIDDNRFKLSSTKNYITYINITSRSTYTYYYIEYSPIRVEILGNITVSGISTIGYNATIVPNISGYVVSASPRANHTEYVDNFGYTSIFNYEKYPEVTILEGEGCFLEPVIIDGKINEVIVKSSGENYFNSFNITVQGNGFGANLQPIIQDGKITSVKIINPGVGYASTNTFIEIVPIGKNLKLKANIKSWTINDVTRFTISKTKDGLIFGKNYSYIGNTYGVYFLTDNLRKYFNISSIPTQHSPIIGWSYDGCPIYGPFAFKNIDGTGGIVRMRSGYSLNKLVPTYINFVEEYQFTNSGNLDEHNGRFCITPEYPKGVYAYFCTFDTSDTPEFPYIIGDTYNCNAPKENFDLKYNQNLNFNNLDITKYTKSYNVDDKNHVYEYFQFFNDINQKDIIVEKSSDGKVENIDIINGGIDYQINDSIVFDNEGTSGLGVIAKVSELDGVGISTIENITYSLSNITFISDGNIVIGIASTYHSLKNNTYVKITGISSSTYSNIEGFRQISTKSIKTGLTTSISNSSVTGLVTSIQIRDSILQLNVDSYLKIGNEVLKIIGLDYKNNLVNVLRDSGSPNHLSTETVEILSNQFEYTYQENPNTFSEINQSYYFNPTQSVCLLSDKSVGIGTTLTIYPLGYGVSYTKYIPTGGIYLPNNKFKNGEKITYSAGNSTIVSELGNLDTIQNLYIIKLEDDVIRLVNNKQYTYDTNTPNFISYSSPGSGLHKFTTNRNIITGSLTENTCKVSTSSTHGIIANDIIKLNVKSGISTTFVVSYSSANYKVLINSQENPKINVYANQPVIFDLSSVTLNDTEFNLFTDNNFKNRYIGNSKTGIEVIKTSTSLTLNISDYTPRNLYYTLTSNTKKIYTDDLIPYNNSIIINNSIYNTTGSISTSTDYQFTFNLKNTPEVSKYTSDISTISYDVLKSDTKGPIKSITLLSQGSQYKKLPKITSVNTISGNGHNLFPSSTSIGKIISTKVNNTQFICPFDKTLRPSTKIFSTLKLVNNFTVDKINVIYGGSNYINPPIIKLYNFKEDKIISNFSAISLLKNSSINQIKILNPGYGLNSNDNRIITLNNGNGYKILNASVAGTSVFTITLTIQTPVTGFTTANPLEINVGDKITIEGIVNSSSIGNGFNCSDYKYDPFIVSYVDPAYGSQDAAIVRYQLNSYPGSFDSNLSYSAFVIPYKNIPIIETILKENEFYNGEGILDTNIIDNIKNEKITNLVKVKTGLEFSENQIIIGKSSLSQGKILEIGNFNSIFLTDSSVTEVIGGKENRGYLSSNIQKLSDNDYYQKFSYSLKSKIPFQNWNSSISNLSHISGYKKFSDLIVESLPTNKIELNKYSTSNINVILTSYANVNSIHDLDLVTEEDIDSSNEAYSQYLKFNSLRLGQSLKSTNNRVLSIDDISTLFTTEKITPKLLIDTIQSKDTNVLKYEFLLSSTKSFLGSFEYPEYFEVFITRDLDDLNLVSYSYFYDFETLGRKSIFGEFTVELNPNDSNNMLLYFSPTNPYNKIDIKAFKETAPSQVGIATTSIGYTRTVELTQQFPATLTPTPQVFYTIPISECNSGQLIVGFSSLANGIEEYFESSFVNTRTGIFSNLYSESLNKDLGEIGISTNGSNIELTYTGISNIPVTLQANIKFLTNTYAGYNSITKTVSKISSSRVTTSGTTSIGISTISGAYGSSSYIIEVQKTIGVTTQKSLIQINSIHFNDYLNNIAYDIIGDVEYEDLSFTSDYNFVGNQYVLYFNPTNSANYDLKIYQASLLSANQ